MNDAPQNAIRSYRPGGWYAVFGEHACVLLPESEKPRVAALWELVDAGAGFDELLDALIATGLRSLPGFVLVSTAEDPTRIVLRGAARAVVTLESGEAVDVDGGAAATWVEQALSGVVSLQLVLEDAEEAVDFGIRGGLVRVSRVDQPPVSSGTMAPAAGAAAASVPTAASGESEVAPADAGQSSGAGAGVGVGAPATPYAAPVVAPVVGFDPLTDDLPEHAYAQEPVVEEPAADEIAGARSGETPSVEAPAVEEPPAAAVEEPVVDEPPAAPVEDLPIADEPVAYEPVADEVPEAGADAPTEAHAFPFFNDPDPETGELPAVQDADAPAKSAWGDPEPVPEPAPAKSAWGDPEPVPEPVAEEAPVEQTPEAPAKSAWGDPEPAPAAEAPAEPAWGQPEQPAAETGQAPAAAAPPSEPAWGQPQPPADATQPPSAPPAEPAWGQPQQGNVYTPSEAPSNPFAPGADNPAEPPMWEPPAPASAPQWGAPQAPEAPAWGNQGDVQDADHDGNTAAGGYQADQFARQHPGIPGQPPAPSVTAHAVARLVFSSGETIDVDRAVLVGRAPEARRFTSTDQPRLVTVPSPNQEISSTHLEVRPGSGVDHGSAIVTDMGSTNGTVLTQPGFAPEDLQPGIAVQLLPGSVIDLGDGVTIQVTSL
ncbi:FHA domain-containing protein [Nocardioides sp. Soil796]|uniref:FHA domain-containing protein n=1 Tax=Nocardioides sp. Soil796 TaxID=1736412 RepID=UPI0007097F6B|nr:FHA domain-containing protein [Nocardioides sp. Soil796]KRF14489.1 hypothetical protein ASH02_09180 [Nocardioides sp. Soil796]